ncbi:hypothetical protein A2526_06530 [candidate division WOR-1 bacterium RIFOXYD2_FULL_36_8]|uniref:Uncharacterized protein n=1 Tax=candidate division WOR-1 bacterium RIFOXYB2_FULL_36_35 TaxID=1802578 RepID=A0A1F4S2L1_UNCSA|nr:MAG: hypothetical protein A2230_04480 [candidate division WOR-1 bacterium RIFOXYA2_FULL_36_21]OGC14650.1 MAG: hypothetical protein A2290_01210 [candidate division WOR-1 bacterium RIFOXYB2_FULL_36_35]OGC19668.1 MAG: hypothetical protein A2282_02935 [candidate division WOR-1 bacterium RIFOXYA12_FULL_36_13]OGC38008.1 MAG: hypothetical protein A2526_06530 [candidate division WOR-1 bacterium RIFOXYD2_FULL_36_8]
MENQSKAIMYISNHLITDYVQQLTKVKFGKIVLFPTFPITGAPNISMPVYFAEILNLDVVSDLIVRNKN